ncbi:MAG: long-chain fatty acid--CoA ligase [Nitrososphaerota archaeon]|jgi:long-chain acyl-CoA synthetase|nr:long-chain fatty acid--CoA ligase [Nitrososphaerota archaeon]
MKGIYDESEKYYSIIDGVESKVRKTFATNHITYSGVSLQKLLEVNAQKALEDAVFVFGNRCISYLELDLLCNQFANGLLSLGVAKNDRVALYLPNIPQFVIAYFGALRAGAIVTTISPLWREQESQRQLYITGAQTIVTLDTLYPIVETILEKTFLENVIVTEVGEYGNSTVSRERIAGTINFGTLMALASESIPDITVDSKKNLAVLQFTGGTTGTAKAAMLTHHNLVSNALSFATVIGATQRDIFLSALPLFHSYGMTTGLVVPISLGAKIVLLPKFETDKVGEIIQRHHITVFCGVPTMYQRLLADATFTSYDLSSLRVCISGACALPLQVQKHFKDVTGKSLVEGYGLTEASPITHCTPMEGTRDLRMGSIGLPLPDTEAKIVDWQTGEKTLAPMEIGELTVRGPQVMAGYWHQPDETNRVLCNGWLLTGDLAYMDNDGYYYIVDRKKDLIKYKGTSIYPRELEEVLYTHPAVELCSIVGVSDVSSGEIPKAYVVLREAVYVSEQDLKEFVNTQVASYKALNEIEIVDSLPQSPAGKVLKRCLTAKTYEQ